MYYLINSDDDQPQLAEILVLVILINKTWICFSNQSLSLILFLHSFTMAIAWHTTIYDKMLTDYIPWQPTQCIIIIMLCLLHMCCSYLSLAVCSGGCKNGGRCISPDTCACQFGFSGPQCAKGKNLLCCGLCCSCWVKPKPFKLVTKIENSNLYFTIFIKTCLFTITMLVSSAFDGWLW